MPTLVKILNSTEWGLTVGLSSDKYGEIGAIGVDGDTLVVTVGDTTYTWNEAMALEGMTPEAMAQRNVIEITEEEFLNNTFTKE